MPFPILAGKAITDTTYEVANSCRFDKAGTAYMHKSQGTPSSRRTFTYSGWIKLGLKNIYQIIFESANGSHNFQIVIQDDSNNNDLRIYDYDGSTNLDLRTSQAFRDHIGWYHVCVAIDTTQSTASNRAKLYINGTRVTAFDTETYPDQNYDTAFVANKNIQVGRQQSGSDYFDGYMAEVCFIDGSALAPTSFGEFNEDSPNIWQPIDVSGLTFGNNGFYLDFEDSGNLGNDVNGGTDLTEVNLAAADQATDTPTNNFCTINPLQNYFPASSFAEGNCKVTTSESVGGCYNHGTFGVINGLWYFEAKLVSGSGAGSANDGFVGISSKVPTSNSAELGNYVNDYGYYGADGQKRNNNSNSSYGDSYSTGDIVGVYIDCDANKLYFAKNGTVQNSGTGISISATADADGSTGYYFPAVGDYATNVSQVWDFNFGGCSAFSVSSGNADANGYGSFEYDPSSGTFDSASKNFLALCTKNLGSDGG